MKRKRHQALMRIISEKEIQTQEQLTQELCEKGFAVTQATVSRDIKELGLIKAPSVSGGYKYAVTTSTETADNEHLSMFSKAVISVDNALHTVVIRTYAGMAQAVAASLDKMFSHDMLGTVAGDDTVLLICRSEKSAEQAATRLLKMFERKDDKDA